MQRKNSKLNLRSRTLGIGFKNRRQTEGRLRRENGLGRRVSHVITFAIAGRRTGESRKNVRECDVDQGRERVKRVWESSYRQNETRPEKGVPRRMKSGEVPPVVMKRTIKGTG